MPHFIAAPGSEALSRYSDSRLCEFKALRIRISTKGNLMCVIEIPAAAPSWPPPLKPGDKAAVIAPSSPPPDTRSVLRSAVRSLKALGLKPVIMPGCRMRTGHLAGPDRQRARDMNAAFANDDIRGIFCLRGGCGAMRLLPLLDTDIIRRHPKVFIGYSDITALHVFLNQRCGLVTFHGPMAGADYTTMDAFTVASMKRRLFHTARPGPIAEPPGRPVEALLPGRAEGILAGGNLTVLAAGLGTPYEIDTRGRILFLEDVNEPLYRLDRNLTSLALAGKFDDCTGVLLGTFEGCPLTSGPTPEALSLEDILKGFLEPLGKPVVRSLQAGHSFPQVTLPLGACLRMEAERKASADENAVSGIDESIANIFVL